MENGILFESINEEIFRLISEGKYCVAEERIIG